MEEPLIKRGAEPKLLAFLVVQQGLFLAAGIGLWLWSGASLGDFLRPDWAGVVLGIVLAAGLAGLIALALLPRPALLQRLVREQGRTVFSTERPYRPGAILIISCSAGIGEEALFRGGVQTLLAGFLPAWTAILVTTALFTIAHPGSPMLMSFVAALGLLFGLAFHVSGSLIAVMIGHALFDVFACLWIQRELRRLGHWQADVA